MRQQLRIVRGRGPRAGLARKPPSCSCGAADRRRRTGVVEAVAPGNPYLGVMLPYTPLHHLLLEVVGRPLVCTSGNLSEEPMAIATDALRTGRRLRAAADGAEGIADVLLVHDRPIVRPVDDSVARCDAEGLQVLRRAGAMPRCRSRWALPARRRWPSAAI